MSNVCFSLQVVLQLKLLGVGMIDSFPFVTPPSTLALRKAFELLLSLDALQSVRNAIHHYPMHIVLLFFFRKNYKKMFLDRIKV